MNFVRTLLLWLALAGCLFAEEPAALYLTWQKSPHTTMTINWITQGRPSGDTLEFQRSGESAWHKAQGGRQPLPDKFGFILHRVQLEGLNPNQEYAFRLPDEGKIYKFKTLSSDRSQPLRFIVGGDVYHDDISFVSKMNQQAARLNPSFIVLGGDLSYNELKDSVNPKQQNRWLDLLVTWKKDFVSPEGRLIPVLPLIGNHDVSGRWWGTTPGNAPWFYTLFPTYGYSSFDIGDLATLLLLDSGHTHKIKGEQTQWLQNALSSRSQVPHKFAIYHVAAWPSCRKMDGVRAKDIRHNWIPLFEKYGVQMAFEHHDHAYKRTYPLREGKIDPKGIIFIGDGCWGVEEPRTPREGRWYIAKGMPKRNIIAVNLHQNTRHLIVYDDEGTILDEIYSQ